MFNAYKESMNELLKGDKPADEEVITKNHRSFCQKIADKLNEKFQNWLEVGKVGEYKKNLMDAL